jgi:hypothetical protein
MKKIIILLMVLLGFSSAISFNIDSEKGVYNPGSNILVYADITNNDSNVLSAVIYSTLVTEGRSDEAVISTEVYLAPNESKKVAIYNFKLTNDYRPGEYTVTATMVANKSAVGYGQDTFMINGTPGDMSVYLLSCTDSTCTNQSSMFLTGSSAYLDFNSTTAGLSCTAQVSAPSGIKTTISLPSSITLREKGTYAVSSTCTKSGYNDATPSLMLGTLPAWPTVKTIQNCNENGICDNNENHSICPQDCPEPEAEGLPIPLEYIIGAVAVIIAAILIWKFVLSKK